MSAALVIFAVLALARFVLIAAIAVVALVTKDCTRRATAMAILPVLRTGLALRRELGQPTETK
ncbi:hypothetical protein [Klenkia sp. PcliD-1-E]|uniref:hypothetical protein n=1 Tax=Klenkia sp. PcliD-1-E TaxID=2954492 RepID=UPI0020974482|nr:hypothetical protein [Klenkia sp. PcliD-1-E]MCO7219508.1 hypothetical protein [Klenkia sp. PcliD-1-E]